MSSAKKDTKPSLLFDAGPMVDNSKTGVGYYVASAMTALANEYDNSIPMEGYYFNFLGRKATPKSPIDTISYHGIRFFPSKLLSLFRRLGFQPPLRALMSHPYDHVLFTNYLALPTPSNTHVTLFVYDLSFMDCPEFLQEVNLKVLRKFCPESIYRADTIITISEFTKERIQHHFPDIKANIVVTPIPPLALKNQKLTLNERLKSLGVTKKKYILYLGTLEPRKNIAQLVRAYSQLPEKITSEYSLVLAGGRGWKDDEIVKEIEAAKIRKLSVIQTGYVSDEEKGALYSQAACFVMPSHYEGFGMPVLEAMSYDTPVALSDIPVFHEVANDAALYFNKDDPSDIANKIIAIIHDIGMQKRLIKNGHATLASFDSWSDNAHKIMDGITQVKK